MKQPKYPKIDLALVVAQGLLIAAAMCLSTGCVATFEESRLVGMPPKVAATQDPEDRQACRELDDSRIFWSAIGKGSGAIAGGAGVSTIPFEDYRDARIALASVSAGAAALAVTSLYVADQKGAAWARDCSQ